MNDCTVAAILAIGVVRVDVRCCQLIYFSFRCSEGGCYMLPIVLFLFCYRTQLVASPRQIDCALGLCCLAIPLQGHRQRGASGARPPQLKSVPPHFTFGPLVAAYI